MGKMTNLGKRQDKICFICQRGARIGHNRPKSLQRTKRLFKVNLQFKIIAGQRQLICSRCLKTLKS